MKKIEAILTKKFEGLKVKTQMKKIETALDAANANAEDQLADIELETAETLENIADSMDITYQIQQLSDIMSKKDNVKKTIARIKDIRKMFNEEVKN